MEHQKRLVEDLKSIQETLGLDKLIEPQENYVRAQFIDERIDELLVEDSFFFYKIFKDSEKDFDSKNNIELEEIKRLVDAIRNSDKFYLKNG